MYGLGRKRLTELLADFCIQCMLESICTDVCPLVGTTSLKQYAAPSASKADRALVAE